MQISCINIPSEYFSKTLTHDSLRISIIYYYGIFLPCCQTAERIKSDFKHPTTRYKFLKTLEN